ncbi:helix-turn-helix transcriptional regulator [Devosia sp. Root105]|jgi:phage repressor protein C with HTH and peptisase S24 domain|uniref:S24 family peptidase n=1 Tax=Devosia sp. Root105 TaxID=1736423 RepID=UPI000700EFCB|nr:helix-turn-helix transcriptional regulator [Devosia sp. Root105]KQU92980.1 DNA-binding protein [Devosia sp. Root105]
MLSHSDIWNAIDTIAGRHGLSASGLARLAGLDATAFNRSKRISKDGRKRWPSTESVAKVLEATNESFDAFLAGSGAFMQVRAPNATRSSVPLLGLGQAGSGGFFDAAGFPQGQGWDEVAFPSAPEDGSYALEVSGDSMQPLYRDGDIIVVSPTMQMRRGDRVVVRTRAGEVLVKVLYRLTPKLVELHSLNPAHPPRILAMKDVEGMGRIVWASQ